MIFTVGEEKMNFLLGPFTTITAMDGILESLSFTTVSRTDAIGKVQMRFGHLKQFSEEKIEYDLAGPILKLLYDKLEISRINVP